MHKRILIWLTVSLMLIICARYYAIQPELQMINVKGGEFTMGSIDGDGDEKPQRQVMLSDFQIGKYEVTHREYIAFLNASQVNSAGSLNGIEIIDMDDIECAVGFVDSFYFKGSSSAADIECPVIEITWYGAAAYCNWLSEQAGLEPCFNYETWEMDISLNGFRLPTEAEWEFAAAGGIHSRGYIYAGSNDPDLVAEHAGNNDKCTMPTGGKAANELAIHDMSGNVWEWCADWWGRYKRTETINPEGPDKGRVKILRGGSWDKSAESCRIKNRYDYQPVYSFDNTGMRIAKTGSKIEENTEKIK